MKWLKNETDTALHLNMCFVGGILGIYALMLRGGNFGSAQTGNLLEAVIAGLGGNISAMAARLGGLVIYAAALILSFLLAKRFKDHAQPMCLLAEGAVLAGAGFVPETADPVLALYPVFFAAAFQWGIFSGAKGYNSATIFSTNNVKQMLLGWTEYIRTRDCKFREKGVFYTLTLTFFHLGAAGGFFFVRLWQTKAVWVCLAPLALAGGLTGLKRRWGQDA